MCRVSVCETFESIQGESSYAGLTCFFIRLSGCNLRCRYCDTPSAYTAGTDMDVLGLAECAADSRAALVEVTGGEPLLQAGFVELAVALRAAVRKPVLVETNGSRDISVIPAGVVAVMDVKCPGSGESASFDGKNLRRLRPDDEVKFVLSDRQDYEWARAFVIEHGLLARCPSVLFSPVWDVLSPSELGTWLVEDGLAVRLQVPLHKVLHMR